MVIRGLQIIAFSFHLLFTQHNGFFEIGIVFVFATAQTKQHNMVIFLFISVCSWDCFIDIDTRHPHCSKTSMNSLYSYKHLQWLE